MGTSFLSAALVFSVQPMVTKQILPVFGGAPAVWNTSVLFFQFVLLVGYLYAHVLTGRLGRRSQIGVHLALLLLVVLALPVAVTAEPGSTSTLGTITRVLVALAAGVGAPFLVVSTSGPLVQRWFSWTEHPRRHDPYFLYAAGNAGSLLGLLAYPTVIEPSLDTSRQVVLWSVGYLVLGVGLVGTARYVWRASGARRGQPEIHHGPLPGSSEPVRREGDGRDPSSQPWIWTGYAFLPSSLMLGVTTHLTTDVAAVPLLWVVPLAIYLASLIVAFGGPAAAIRVTPRLWPGLALLVGISELVGWPLAARGVLHLSFFAVLSVALHGRLAARRPPVRDLTRFYLWVAVGGALGGLLNGMLAPLVFDRVVEYPLVLAVSILALAAPSAGLDLPTARHTFASMARAAAMLVPVTAVMVALTVSRLAGTIAVGVAALMTAVVQPLGRWRMVAGLLAVLLLAPPALTLTSVSLYRTRTFFGVHDVRLEDGVRVLSNGTTVHGTQAVAASERRTPTAYYHPDGPLGDVFGLPITRGSVGVIGLGAGAIAAYGVEGQRIRFHEIDPTVAEIAAGRGGFTYLDDSRADVEIVLGDGRLTLGDVDAGEYHLLILDAFSSDSIPVHLLTEEAFIEYGRVTSSDGLLVIHISNRYLDLAPVLAGSAGATGFVAVERSDLEGAPPLRSPSRWVALSRTEEALAGLRRSGWTPLDTSRLVAWTDGYSNLLSVLR